LGIYGGPVVQYKYFTPKECGIFSIFFELKLEAIGNY
jgi:hypothetical protein